MNKNALLRLVLIAWALLTATFASATDLQMVTGPCPVVAIGPHTVFGAQHASWPFTAASLLTKDGKQYVPPGSPSWVRFVDKNGVVQEEHASGFTFHSTDNSTNDRWFGFTYRAIPQEAWETIATVTNGQPIVVSSRALGTNVLATVRYLADGYITTTYPAIADDSASRVRTLDGRFVGLVSKRFDASPNDPAGCTVVIPNLTVLAGTTPVAPAAPPAPVAGTNTAPAPPIPTTPVPVLPIFTQAQLDAAVTTAKATERASVVAQFEALIKQLKQ